MEVEMKALVIEMAKALVDNTEEVAVNEVEGDRTTVFELRVAKTDIGKIIGKQGNTARAMSGKIIGKQGNTARAMRTILNAAGTKLGKRFVLEILE
jgi:predicted RNA-binding protein YlqC (UPF0109 family)